MEQTATSYCYESIQKGLQEPKFRAKDHTELIKQIQNDLKSIPTMKKTSDVDFPNLVRVVRNLCINSRMNQDHLLKTDIPNQLIRILVDDDIGSTDVVKSVGLQCIGNMLVGNPLACKQLWPILYPDLLQYFMTTSAFVDKHFTICSMILYNCLVNMPDSIMNCLFSSETGKNLVVSLCDCLPKVSDPDWICMLINQHFFMVNIFFTLLIHKCVTVTVIGIFQLLGDTLDNKINVVNNAAIDTDFLVDYLCKLFIETSDGSIRSGSKIQADFLVSIIETLCRATAFPGHWNKNEIVTKGIDVAIELLRAIHLRKSRIDQTSEFQIYDYLHSQLVKRSIVRMIGNMCFENEGMQNRIRENDGISLILECCTIDDNNPFIQQWAIFAIRNICQNNHENQAAVGKLEKIGVADSPILKSMGLTVAENDKGKMAFTRIDE